MHGSEKPANHYNQMDQGSHLCRNNIDRNIFPDCLKTSIQMHDQQKRALPGKNVQINNIEDALVIQRLGNHC